MIAMLEFSTLFNFKNLVGGFNPCEKYKSNMGIFPNFRDEHKKYLSYHHPRKPMAHVIPPVQLVTLEPLPNVRQ